MAIDFVNEFETWEKSPLLSCENCDEFAEYDETVRDCPYCSMSLCYDCAEDHPKDGDCDDEDDDWTEEDEDEEDDDLTDDDEDDSEEWE